MLNIKRDTTGEFKHDAHHRCQSAPSRASLHRTDAGLARYVAENAGVSLHAKTRGGTRQHILKVAHDQDDLQGRVYAFVDKCVRPVCGDAPRGRGLQEECAARR